MSATKKAAEPGEVPAKDEATEPELTYEQARAELDDVVIALETGGATLEESVALYRRGEKLAAICQRHLDGAKAALEVLPAA